MVSEARPYVDAGDIYRLVGVDTFARGSTYARNGAVVETDWDAATDILTATVLGSEARPYLCRVNLVPSSGDQFRPVLGTCSCPVGTNCKHVAAALLASNTANIMQRVGDGLGRASDLATGEQRPDAGALVSPGGRGRQAQKPPQAPAPQPTQASAPQPTRPPTWQETLAALTGGGASASSTPPTPMGLQFELREQTPRTRDRWRGPTAKTAGAVPKDDAVYRLGVRPVIQSHTGNWVRENLSWNTLNYISNRLTVSLDQQRWFSQFVALHRSSREMFVVQEADWLYLDDFHSPLLWRLLDDAVTLGIAFVLKKKDSVVTLGSRATLRMDVTTLRDTSKPDTSDLELRPVLDIDGAVQPIATAGAIGDHGVYTWRIAPRTELTLAPTSARLTDERRALLTHTATTTLPAAEVDEFLTDFYPNLTRIVEVTSSDESVAFPEITPPMLVLTVSFQPKQQLTLDWKWEYAAAGGTVDVKPVRQEGDADSARNVEWEDATLGRLRDALAGTGVLADSRPTSLTLRGLDAAEFSYRTLPLLEPLDGLRIDLVGERPDYRELTSTPNLTVTTVETEQRDWFDLGVVLTIDGREVPFGPIFTALARGQTKLLLIDHTYLSLEQPVFEELRRLIEEAASLSEWDTGLRISRYQASLWAEFEDLADETVQATGWRSTVGGLLELGDDMVASEPVPLPAGLDATLRPYQQQGFEWLAFLWRHGLGGILADDMGLGKTLQTLALIAHTVEQQWADASAAAPATTLQPAPEASARRPFLVVAPTSVVPNWLSEAARFTPGLTVRAVTSTVQKSREQVAVSADGADIVITSYALFRLDFAQYQAVEWAGLILDEAQFVKNPASRAHACAVELNAPFTLAITGTPMENSLTDLWSLFRIVAPGLFASGRKFTEEYVKVIAAGDSPETLARLRRRIRPLMLRRTKELVATDLPEKQEQVLRIELAPRHKKLYDTFLQRERQKLLGLLDDMDKNRFIVFRSLTLLRMLSLDASLVDEKYSDIPSSKLDALFEQLDDVVAEGHRALVFSQFTSFLKKAAQRMDDAGIPYEYLDGSTTKRADVIARFRTGDAPVFLISLKAGGFGLNLTEADYVFLLDPWWNPATENQAVDRTHRIGQTRSVNVYRMAATGTIEEKVMALRDQKAKLFDAVMDDDAAFSTALTADDIRGLLEA